MKQHYGEILEQAIRQSGIPISKIAKKVGYTRQHLYNLFEQQTIDLNLMLSIGEYIHYDFSDKIQNLKKYKQIEAAKILSTVEEPKKSYENFERKYYDLLEEYSELLKAYNKLIKNKNKSLKK